VISWISYAWRLLWTLVAVAVLMFGGFVIAVTLVPVATVFVRDEPARNRRTLSIIHQSFRAYVTMLRAFGILRLEIVGGSKLSRCKGKLVVANHPTLLDVVLLVALLPDTKCVVKSELFNSRLMGPIVRAAGYIRNDSDAERFVETCRETLDAGYNLIIFPEGTRSVPGKPIHFHRGFAHVATLTGANLQPILITCQPITLVKGEPYYRIPASRPLFRIEIEDELDPKQFFRTDAQSRARRARALASYLEADYGWRMRQCLTSNAN